MADPIQDILPVSEAFKEGTLEMATTPGEAVVPESLVLPVPTIVTVAFLAIFAIIVILNFYRVAKTFPRILNAVFNKSIGLGIELNSESAATRNLIAAALLFPLCIVLDHSELFVPHIFTGIPHGIRTLAYLGMALAFIVSRLFFGLFFRKPRKLSFDYWRSSRTSFYSFFCLMAILTTVLGSTVIFFGFDKGTVAMIALAVNALIYLLELVRVGEILRESCSVFSTILYLCGLEIAPAAAMVAISIWL